eukprot:gene38418-50445_t
MPLSPEEPRALRDKYAGSAADMHDPRFAQVAASIFSAGGTRAAPYAGVPTLLSAPHRPVDAQNPDFGDLQVALMGAPMDLGASNRPGARFGPRALRTIERIGPYNHVLDVAPVHSLRVADVGDVPFRSRYSLPMCIEDLEAWYHRVADQGVLPLTVGGDHSINIPCIEAFADQGPIHILQIDAHLDFVDERHGVKVGHGSPLRRAAEKAYVTGMTQVGIRNVSSTARDGYEAARAMGAVVTGGPNWLQIERGAWPLKAIELDCNHIPDAAMTLAVMALYAEGTTVLRNIASWRVKETDRIAAMAHELRKLGATVEEGHDYLKITPPANAGEWKTAPIHTYDDHRVAMCFSLAAFNPAQLPVRILDPKCVGKTFPDYFETLFSVAHADSATIPVICVDGPTASGKGTLASTVAQALGYHYLDSGALYRLSALAASRSNVSLDDAAGVAAIAQNLPVRFEGDKIFLGQEDVSDAVRTEAAGMAASQVSVHPEVRTALLLLQRSFRKLPGLVADGRDMGTVIFPDATLKIYLTASSLHRAERRHKQLISKGNSVTLSDIRQDLEARDKRDTSRTTAPLKPADN